MGENAACWKEAQRYLVGGVNSPVRSFQAVGGAPFFVDRGQGAYLWDVEGKRYLDFVGSWGALILGHRHPEVIKAIQEALERGTTFGTATSAETALARMISEAIPSMEQIRFVSSGTEAVMSAIRLARAATKRSKVLKFEGAYHGHLDSLLAKAGSGMSTLGLPASAGVPAHVAADTINIPFNNEAALKEAIRRHRKRLACVLVEPVMANVGVIPPADRFLPLLRKLTREEKILLIFDEVITGFRLAYGGAQRLFGLQPDLTILGKIIGGGFPIGAYGASRRLMGWVAPAGPVYQAGTLSGHPVAMAAGLATLKVLRRPGTYLRLNQNGQRLQKDLISISRGIGVPVVVHQIGGLLSLFFSKGPVRNGRDANRASRQRYVGYFRQMLRRGVYLPPSAYEAWFLSTAMGEPELEWTARAHRAALGSVR